VYSASAQHWLPTYVQARSLHVALPISLPADVAAVALCEHVLAPGLDRLPGDDPAAHGGLDRHVEQLSRDQLPQLLGHLAAVVVQIGRDTSELQSPYDIVCRLPHENKES